MQLRNGSRLFSVVDDAQVIVVRAPEGDVEVLCGGHPVVSDDDASSAKREIVAGHEGVLLIGKRYADPASGLELLCTKAGAGALSSGGAMLEIKSAKALPASD